MTQAQQVAAYLRAKGTITSVTAIGMYGITRLSAVIHTMNKKGANISVRQIDGVKGKYAEYYNA